MPQYADAGVRMFGCCFGCQVRPALHAGKATLQSMPLIMLMLTALCLALRHCLPCSASLMTSYAAMELLCQCTLAWSVCFGCTYTDLGSLIGWPCGTQPFRSLRADRRANQISARPAAVPCSGCSSAGSLHAGFEHSRRHCSTSAKCYCLIFVKCHCSTTARCCREHRRACRRLCRGIQRCSCG